MGLYSYDIAVASASAVTVTAVMSEAPTYTVTAVRLLAEPVFNSSALINGVSLLPGDPLVSATGGTVTSTSPLIVYGATTAARSSSTISGTYSSATTSAAFVIPFGTTFNSATAESDVGGSPRRYSYEAHFVTGSVGATALAERIISGDIQMTIGVELRVPAGGTSSNKAISVTQV